MPDKKRTKTKEQPGKQANTKYYFALGLILVISFFAYLPILHNDFVNWDDDKYILGNKLIQSLSLKDIFSSYVVGNYHPLTMLIYAVEYRFFGLNAHGFHIVGLLLHLITVILVYRVVLLLSNKNEVGLIAALLFGIHPMHVESVAWASELKDLLYVFFFLAAYNCYLLYLKAGEKKFYFYCLLLFLLSLFSKGMAVSLPFVLLLTDYFKGRKMGKQVWVEKIPFLALSVLFGMIAIHAQKTGGAINLVYFPFVQRIVFACYSFIIYIVKLVLPFNLCAFYSYPIKAGESMPAMYYLFVLLFAALAYGAWHFRSNKKILFGLGFFAITVALVLQLLPVGSTVTADRYSYLPSVGIFYLVTEGLFYLWNKKKLRTPAILLLTVLTVFYSVNTYSQCLVWKNSLSLWNDVISKDQTIPVAYYDRGCFYENEKNYDAAISDFDKAIALQPNYDDAYQHRGIIFKELRRYDEAIADLSAAVKINPDRAEAYNNRGVILNELKKYDEAISDYNNAIRLKADYAEAYNNRGIVYSETQQFEKAISDLNKVIELQPDFVSAYNNRGIVFIQLKRYEEAQADFNKAISINPSYVDAYADRAQSFKEQKKYEEAISDYSKVLELRPDLAAMYYKRGELFNELKKYREAFADFNTVIEAAPDQAAAWYNRGVAAYYLEKKEDACNDFRKAAALGYTQAADAISSFCQ